MRLWSLHPKYLDPKGLVAVWREALLAQKVLLGQTKGYRHHPQLERFRSAASPPAAIGHYLRGIAEEAVKRGYTFNEEKIFCGRNADLIPVSSGQISFETGHLEGKLKIRDVPFFKKLQDVRRISVHPLFKRVKGGVESWERAA